MTTPATTTRLRFFPGPIRVRRGFTLGFLATLFLGLLVLTGASIGVALGHGNTVMPGVVVGDVSVGGLDREAAAARLEAELPPLSEGALTLNVDGQVARVPLGELDRHYDIDATLDTAFGVARSGNPLQDGIDRLRVLTGPIAAGDAVIIQDHQAIEDLVATLGQRFEREPQDASVRQSGAGFVAVPAVSGLVVEKDALRASLEQLLVLDGTLPELDVLVTRRDPAVSTDQAAAAARAASSVAAQRLVLKVAGKKLTLDRTELAAIVSFGATESGWGMTLDPDAVRHLLKPIARQLASAPRNASFTWGGGGVTGVIPAEVGRKLKVDASVARLTTALQRRAGGSTVPTATLVVGVAQPGLTTAEARAAAPKMRQLGTWTTYFVPSEGNFWGANITIPARDIDGRVIAPGEWFEFWQGIGPVTLAHGYGYGGAIIGGRSVANGALAGGICSTSTTLFNAAMRSGLEIGERTNHSYYIDRYPTGLDATVFKTDDYETDMTFRNDTDNPIVIRSYWGTSFLRFDIWGVPDGRKVTLSAPSTSNHGTARWTTVFNPDLPAGTSVIREYPHDGFDAVVTRWVRDADGNLLHEDTWTSHYRTVNGVTEYGPKKSSS
jgi:vancomycin resistance protein YoaR